jgi:hypothetical protein
VEKAFPLVEPECRRHLDEPTAAALSIMTSREVNDGDVFLIYDLGGGTFDVTVMEACFSAKNLKFRVLALGGAAELGGDAMDQLIFERFKEIILKDYPGEAYLFLPPEQVADEKRSKIARRFQIYLLEEAALCKMALASHETYTLVVRMPPPNNRMLEKAITRADIKQWIAPILQKIEKCVEHTLEAVEGKKSVRTVMLIGGSTCMPIVQESVRNWFGVEPYKSTRPAEEVARGAAIYSSFCAGALSTIGLKGIEKIEVEQPPEARLGKLLGLSANLGPDEQVFWPLPLNLSPLTTAECLVRLRGQEGSTELVFAAAPLGANPADLLGVSKSRWSEFGIQEIAKGKFGDLRKWGDQGGAIRLSFRLVPCCPPRLVVQPVGAGRDEKLILDLDNVE